LEVAVRVLGVDPGTVATGWGVVEEIDRRLTYVAGGVIRARGPLAQRLARVYEQIQQILSNFAPTCISLEKTFVGDNVQSAFRLGEARGAILVAAAQAGIPVQEYSPAEIKVAVAGNGRAAKEQMQLMVRRLLGLAGAVASDEADALVAALREVVRRHEILRTVFPVDHGRLPQRGRASHGRCSEDSRQVGR
jgi:crossover junction endodeoxyribonuclease RuvC